jgi:MFS family permease
VVAREFASYTMTVLDAIGIRFGPSHIAPLLVWSLAARLHVASTAIAVTLLVTGWERSYTWAGATVAGLTVGQGLAGPLNGRLADRFRVHRVLAATALLYADGLSALALLPTPAQSAAPLVALIIGAFQPPVSAVARRTWSRPA